MNKNTTLGVNILKLCKAKGIKQVELAEKIGITPTSLNRYIKGVRVPKIDMLVRIADGLGVTVGELVGEEVNTNDIEKSIDEYFGLIYYNVKEISDTLTKEQKLKLIEAIL